MSKAYDRTLKAWADDKRASLGPYILDLIRGANWDLYCGPMSAEDAEAEGIENWPGFSKACGEIRAALDDVRQLWIDDDAELWTESEPDEDLDLYWIVDRSDLLRAIVGKELVEYVN